MTDDLDDLLTPPTGPRASDALRHDLRAATARFVRRRVWARRAALAGALAACYVAGLATVRLMRPVAPTPIVGPVEVARAEPMAPPAKRIEIEAEKADAEERSKRFLAAGDKHLEERGDLEAALRCYRNGLDAAPTVPEIDPQNDNWLVMALKLARQSETDRESH